MTARKPLDVEAALVDERAVRRLFLASQILIETAEAVAATSTGAAKTAALRLLAEARRTAGVVDVFIEAWSELREQLP